jgi:hypothetical protein
MGRISPAVAGDQGFAVALDLRGASSKFSIANDFAMFFQIR